jgi:hypothetical protein
MLLARAYHSLAGHLGQRLHCTGVSACTAFGRTLGILFQGVKCLVSTFKARAC